MKSLFDLPMTAWPHERNSLHVYALPQIDSSVLALEPFTVDMTGPHIFEHSVGYEGNRSPQWDSLVRSVRAGATAVLGDPAMPPAPHISLGYGTANVDSEPLTAELARLGAERGRQQSVRMHVTEVQLLSVHQDSAAGTYTWDTISTHILGE
ncbi:2'-5' RNA ligase family protein [Rhodococcus sp. NPDC076796]|uniref:2'-5' RNA ligase family protein n=1 Tax=Rhodococcus sp. NPDC076796 TaxID=3154859 RepID=UPI002ADB17B9|nr:2'-5' RNA ligase family protein [Rhodococcus sp. (in: high G+C Gram-positive bacteria)]